MPHIPIEPAQLEETEEVVAATEEVHEAEAAVEEAETPSEIAAAEQRLQDAYARLDARMAQLEATFNDLRTAHEGKADREHNHAMPPELTALHENISAIEREETAPNAVPWHKRRLW